LISWVAAVPTILVSAALLFIPGFAAAWLIRLRGLSLAAGSIAISIAIIAIASLGAPLLDLTWGMLPVLVVAALVTLVALALRTLLKLKLPAESGRQSATFSTIASLFLAGALIFFSVARSIGTPENLSQTYDAVFHLNAVAFIQETGDASPFHMTMLVPDQTTSFYPTLWHAIVAMVATLGNSSIPVATNALSIVVAAGVWPVAVLFFTAPFVRRHAYGLILAAVFAASFTAFPYLLLTWGVLYPNFLSTALLPIVIGFIHIALRPREFPGAGPSVALWVSAVAALGAAIVAHPNGLFGTVLLLFPLILAHALEWRYHRLRSAQITLRLTVVALIAAGTVLIWNFVTLVDSDKPYNRTFISALVEGVTNAPLLDTRSLFLTLFVAAGVLVLMYRRRHRWLVASYFTVILFFAIAFGSDGPIRTVFTGPWYNDAARLAALTPIVVVPLATVSASLLLDTVTLGARQLKEQGRFASTRGRSVQMIALVSLIAILITGARGANMGAQMGWMGGLFDPAPANESGPDLLSAEERALLERVGDSVPEDALIIGDPWNGSAFVYSLAERRTVFPHMSTRWNPDTTAVAADLRGMGPEETCEYFQRMGVDFVLDFGDPNFATYHGPAVDRFSGLRNLKENVALTEIDREGEAALLRVNCN